MKQLPPAPLQPHPQALRSLNLVAPFSVITHIAPDLASFTGLRRLVLQAQFLEAEDPEDSELEDPRDRSAMLRTALLRQLPPQLERLTLSTFGWCGCRIGGSQARAGRAAEPAPAVLRALSMLRMLSCCQASHGWRSRNRAALCWIRRCPAWLR